MQQVVIVGAHSTLARDFVSRYADHAQFHLISRHADGLVSSAHSTVYTANATDLAALSTVFAQISAQAQPIDAVINFCGSLLLKPAHLITDALWQQMLDINLTTAFYTVHLTAKFIQRNCHLILFSSAAASVGLPNHEAIAAVKAGVEGLARSTAATYAAQNLRCNVIAPGMIATTLTQPLLRNDLSRDLSAKRHPLGRIGQPEDVSRALQALLEQQWITGAVLPVDGGLSHVKTFR